MRRTRRSRTWARPRQWRPCRGERRPDPPPPPRHQHFVIGIKELARGWRPSDHLRCTTSWGGRRGARGRGRGEHEGTLVDGKQRRRRGRPAWWRRRSHERRGSDGAFGILPRRASGCQRQSACPGVASEGAVRRAASASAPTRPAGDVSSATGPPGGKCSGGARGGWFHIGCRQEEQGEAHGGACGGAERGWYGAAVLRGRSCDCL